MLCACHGAGPAASPGSPRTAAPASSCKISNAVCDPTVTDEAALALVQHRCVKCHDEGGAAAHPFLNAAALLGERANVSLRLAGCEMPPDETPLPTEERARLIGWGACAAQ
jgi:hypothetical protein